MFHTSKSLVLVLFGFMLILSACQTTGKPSGFLTSYDGFWEGQEGGADMVWATPEIKSPTDWLNLLNSYDKILIDPLWVSMSNREAYDGIDTKELNELVTLFQSELYNAVKDRYEVVYEPGPRVMRLSVALTGVESPSRILAATSTFTPIGLGISTVSRLVTGEHTNVGSATMELVASDSETNKSLFASVDRRPGSKDLAKLIDPLSDAKEAFKWWAGRLRFTIEGGHVLAQ